MRFSSIAAPFLLLALVAGCQAMDFGESTGSSGDDGAGGIDANDASVNGAGGALGAKEVPSESTIGEDPDPSLPIVLNPGFDDPLPLCPGTWPIVTRAPRIETGYASAQYARHLLLGASKQLPHKGSLRVEEFLAYYADRVPIAGRDVDAHFVQTATDAKGPIGYVELRVRRDAPVATEPKHFIVMLDVSPSMSQAMSDDHPLAQEVLITLGDTLSSTADEVSLITFAGGANLEFERTVGAEAEVALDDAAGALDIRAGNDLEAALKLATVVAKGPNDDDYTPTELIILTDGAETVPENIVATLEKAVIDGVRTSVVQLAKGSRAVHDVVIHDQFLHALATAGGGTPHFIGDEAEARLAFGDRFDEAFRIALSDVLLSVTLPSGFESLEEPSISGAPPVGASIGPGRWYTTRHAVSVCQETFDAASGPSGWNAWGALASLEVSEVEVAIPFGLEFVQPSASALLEDAVLETVQFLRSGGATVTSADRAKLDAALTLTGCTTSDTEPCKSLFELEALMLEAAKLR